MPNEQSHFAKKRKRPAYEGPKEKDLGGKIDDRLYQDLKDAKRVAKKAKTFETQKLIKKLKTLRIQKSDPTTISACELELTQLKALDHEALARTALKSKLMKDKLLSGNELIQAAILRELQSHLLASASTGSAAKVQSRVLSSKLLAVEIASIVEGLRAVVLPAADEDDAPPRKVKKVDSDGGEDGDEDVDVEMGSVNGDLDDADAVSDGDDEQGWESGTVGDDEREPDDGWESGSLDGDVEEDGATDDEEEDQVLSSTRSPPAKRVKQQDKSSTSTSTFLPTLSHGFIKGSDDSDWDEAEAKAGDIGERKNRRGQRARRAIWEKKFGKNANHKKKEAQADAEASRKKRAAENAGSRGGRLRKGAETGQHTQRPDTGWGQRNAGGNHHGTERPPPRSAKKVQAPAETLHPSWEAKRRLQERQQQAAAAGAPVASRKIKFT